MAPSILFKRNVVMDDPVELCAGSEKPGSAAVARSAMTKVGWMDLNSLVPALFSLCLLSKAGGLSSPLHSIIFPVALAPLHSDSISRHESFCLIFFMGSHKTKSF